jgi:hypothetical protein
MLGSPLVRTAQVASDKAKTALIVKKIALCNQKLKKPERDGLD